MDLQDDQAVLKLGEFQMWPRGKPNGAIVKHDPPKLTGEAEWLIEGPDQSIAAIHQAFPGIASLIKPGLLSVSFGNAVGFFQIPGIGRIEVVSGKWSESHFEKMLADVTRVSTALPFTAAESGAVPYDRSLADHEDILYHAFVYLRHILSDTADPEERLLPALEAILRQPHRRFIQTQHQTDIVNLRRFAPSGLLNIVSGEGGLTRVASLAAKELHLARTLRGFLPERVREIRIRSSLDTPENRFVKTFLDQALGIVEEVRRRLRVGQRSGFRERVLVESKKMDKMLRSVRQQSIWSEVGDMNLLPAASTVLQLRRGYRQVLHHSSRLRMASRLPLSDRDLRNLLELKDMALLYELWCYFTMVEGLGLHLGSPRSAKGPSHGAFEASLGWGHRVTWQDGTTLLYNPTFSQSMATRRSYSVPLRPDVALRVSHGPNKGLHLFDAKFKVQFDDDLGAEATTGDSGEIAQGQVQERGGEYKRADLYKMHCYRDAIPEARSVWVLYPGSTKEFFYFEADRQSLAGVGTLPLVPGDDPCELTSVLGELAGL